MPDTTPQPLWTPDPTRMRRSTMARFIEFVRDRGVDVSDGDYSALHRWSIGDLEEFWGALAEFFAVDFSTPPRRVLDDRRMPGAKWFPGAELSYTAHIFRERPDDAAAIIDAGELRPLRRTTWGELRMLTARLAAHLRELGVGPGDRVAAYLPNTAEAVTAFLATSSLGAIWSSCSPDFGARAVADRFVQIEPKVLLAVDGYRYGGRDFDRRAQVSALQKEMPQLAETILLPYLDPEARLRGTRPWNEAVAGDAREPPLTQVPFEHPLWILYSSGTTGLPKGLVHSHGGILLEHLKWLALQTDVHSGDRLFWLTTTGWTMWNFVVGGLLTGAGIVLFDGNPGHPDLGTLWDLAQAADVSCFGAGASYYASCRRAGLTLRDAERPLSRLRAVGSTGSPLMDNDFDWIYEQLGDVWLFSTSGGTDVCTAFVGGSPLLPVHRGELQAPALGVDVQAWDPDGRSLRGDVGELVVAQPMPSMPVRLWNDPDGARYEEAYFEMYPGTWRHGDWIEMRSTGGAVIHGRSDSTINRGGVRIGSSEIYAAVLAVPGVEDAVVVELPREGDTSAVLLFVKPIATVCLDAQLRKDIVARLREERSPRHVPDEIVEAPDIPRTLSGKVLEQPLKGILSGVPVERAASRDSLANPEALDWFVEFAARWRAA